MRVSHFLGFPYQTTIFVIGCLNKTKDLLTKTPTSPNYQKCVVKFLMVKQFFKDCLKTLKIIHFLFTYLVKDKTPFQNILFKGAY